MSSPDLRTPNLSDWDTPNIDTADLVTPDLDTYSDHLENPFELSPTPSPPRTTNTQFINAPFPLAFPPQVIPIRMARLTPELKAIDEEYEKEPHPILDRDGMVGKGGVYAAEEEKKIEDASQALSDHIEARMPYCQLTSKRLQAAMSQNNDLNFELPDIKPLVGHPFKSSLNVGPGIGLGLGQNLGPMRQNVSPAILPPGCVKVDPKTGQGLREYMLRIGKETGSMKGRALKSISFHDFTPDNFSGKFSNILVQHYDDSGVRNRIDSFEVDVPTPYIDPGSGHKLTIPLRWIFFFISRKIVSVGGGPVYPPNFPQTIPRSWMVFACPLSNATVYPDQVETFPAGEHDASNSNGEGSSKISPVKRSNPFSTESHLPKITYKRRDYDFSHQGVPLFEFSNATTNIFPKSPGFPVTYNTGDFLSVDSIGPFHVNDMYSMRSLDDFCEELKMREKKVPEKEQSRSKEKIKWDEMECRDRKLEGPIPFNGVWWKKFYKGIYEDEQKWRRVRKAMGRGTCRVVVRWAEDEWERLNEERERGQKVAKRGGTLDRVKGSAALGRPAVAGGPLVGGSLPGGSKAGATMPGASKLGGSLTADSMSGGGISVATVAQRMIARPHSKTKSSMSAMPATSTTGSGPTHDKNPNLNQDQLTRRPKLRPAFDENPRFDRDEIMLANTFRRSRLPTAPGASDANQNRDPEQVMAEARDILSAFARAAMEEKPQA